MTKQIERVAVGFALPQEHHQMISAIQQLPDIPLVLSNDFQSSYLANDKERWHKIGQRLDYLQKRQMGFRPCDPLEKGLHPRHKEYLDVISRQKFAILNLVNEGFDIIRNAAISEGRDFPFQDPRELFTEMCRQRANTIKMIASKEVNQGRTLDADREHLVFLNSFYRDRLDSDTAKQVLHEFRINPLWEYFSLYAIWDYRENSLKHFWKAFLASHKALIKVYRDTQYRDGAKLCKVKWNSGHPVVSETGKPAKFSPGA